MLVQRAHTATRREIESSLIVVMGIGAILTIVRIVGLMTSNVDLYTDESQYWSWSRDLSWGYFSKPPLVAWIIRLAESICGSGEACIRAPSPIFYFASCVLIYLTARKLYGPVVGFWASMVMMFGVALVFSSRIVSTDVPLIFFWSLALYAYVNLLERMNWQWAVVLGLSIGLGMLAKYAMAYFVLGMALAAVFDRRGLALLRSRLALLVFAVAAIVVAPNIVWVVQHSFLPFRNVASAAQTERGFGLHPVAALEFIAAQFAVFGPVVFAAFLYAIARVRPPEQTDADRLMLSFAIPPLLIITVVALISRAYANWAATAVISATILAAALLVRRNAWPWLAFSVALGVLAQIALLFADTAAYRIALPFLPPGKSDVYQRTLGLRDLAAQTARLAASAKVIAGEERRTVSALLYYLRDGPAQILAWPAPDIPTFDADRPLTKSAPQPIFFVSECSLSKRLADFYTTVDKIGEIRSPTGPTSSRHYTVFALSGARGEITPLPPCIP
jgi:4-amino-4-deoxy-L-arabinose transferase-like glycosyltransferase